MKARPATMGDREGPNAVIQSLANTQWKQRLTYPCAPAAISSCIMIMFTSVLTDGRPVSIT